MSKLECDRAIGSRGAGAGHFQFVAGVALDEKHMFVTDKLKHSISVFNRSDGAHILSVDRKGSGNLQFNGPRGVELDEEHLYVVDYDNHRVSGQGQFTNPTCVALDYTKKTNLLPVQHVCN